MWYAEMSGGAKELEGFRALSKRHPEAGLPARSADVYLIPLSKKRSCYRRRLIWAILICVVVDGVVLPESVRKSDCKRGGEVRSRVSFHPRDLNLISSYGDRKKFAFAATATAE